MIHKILMKPKMNSNIQQLLSQLSNIPLNENYKKIILSILSDHGIKTEYFPSDYNRILESIPIEKVYDFLDSHFDYGDQYDLICLTLDQSLFIDNSSKIILAW